MLRSRDAIDRAYAEPLDIPSLAGVAHVSEAHFIRTFSGAGFLRGRWTISALHPKAFSVPNPFAFFVAPIASVEPQVP